MKVMVLVKATAATEAGQMPTEAEFQAMGAFNAQLVEAGIMLAGEGLHPTSRGRRVVFGGERPQVIEGPFTATTELVAGFWLWQVRSLDEATEWLKRAPFGPQDVVEIRPVFSEEDLGDTFTPELRAQEQRLRDRLDNDNQGERA
ncbi:YciI family protein [Stenotrophomonas sp.]|uniref:YciI family protein n=1 Tax=Stenotrophomonas sp. TaxID=69392 RepID=UPI002FC9B771